MYTKKIQVTSGIFHESLVFSDIHASIYASVYTKKLQVTSGIFHESLVFSDIQASI